MRAVEVGDQPRAWRHAEHEHRDGEEFVRSRALRVLASLALGLVAMALVAYALGRLMGTDWVWWLAPVTVAVDGSRLLRAPRPDRAAFPAAFDDLLVSDLDMRLYLASSVAAMALAAGGAYTGNRLALISGAALAILGYALERGDERAGLPGAIASPPNRPHGSITSR